MTFKVYIKAQICIALDLHDDKLVQFSFQEEIRKIAIIYFLKKGINFYKNIQKCKFKQIGQQISVEHFCISSSISIILQL
jgi:hypothetical protein